MNNVITLRFTTHWPPNPFSPIIAVLGGSRIWSHVFAILPDDYAYQSSMFKGVNKCTIEQAMKGVKSYVDMIVPIQDETKCVAWARSQIGADYDWAGVLGIPLLYSTDWQDDSAWWCSEYVFMLLGKGGTWLLDPVAHDRVTPNDLIMCNYTKSEIIYAKPTS